MNDCLLFCKNQDSLNKLVTELHKKHPLTDDDIGTDVYDYLGIKVSMKNNKTTFHQRGLIEFFLKTTGYSSVKDKVKTTAKEMPLALDKDGKPFDEDNEYDSVVGMLLYVVNTRLDVQFAVHSFC